MNKAVKKEVEWKLKYVHDAVKTFGSEETFDVPFYVKHLREAIEMMEGDQKDSGMEKGT